MKFLLVLPVEINTDKKMLKKKISKITSTLLLAIIPLSLSLAPFRISAVEPCSADNIRWAGSSNRIYISGNVSCALTDIETLGSNAIPLELADEANKIWLLKANIVLQNGATLALRGPEAGGDVAELRLKSNNNSESNNYVYITADWGNIDIDSVKITSWDENISGPDTEYNDYGRAYISARSRLYPDGTKGESRMDIKNSDVGNLGYYASESYGLSWKVMGNVFNEIGVFGDVVNNKIHDNFFGAYTYGAQAMKFINNEVYNNIWYGLDPHDDSDFLVIEGNNVYANGKHGIICSKRCNDIQITNNISSYNNGSGIMIHRNIIDSVVSNNITEYNLDAGIAVFDSNNNLISNNISKFNGYGIRFSVGSSSNIVENNDLSNNFKYGIFTYKGTDAPTIGDGRIKSNIFRLNTINSNGFYAAKIKEADYNIFDGNTVESNAKGFYFYYDTPKNNEITNNAFAGNGLYGIKLVGSNNTLVQNNILNNGSYGIYLAGTSQNNQVIGNKTNNNSFSGLRIDSGTGNLLSGNTVKEGKYGIYLLEASDNSIENNEISNDYFAGVRLKGGSNNAVLNNNIVSNGIGKYGIFLESNNALISNNAIDSSQEGAVKLSYSSGNEIIENIMKNGGKDGLILNFSDSNAITANQIDNNARYPIYSISSNNNVFTDNTFTGNGKNYYYSK